MTTLAQPPRAPEGSGADKIAQIRALEAQLASDPNNPSLHAYLAWAYVDMNRWDDAIKRFQECYTLNTNLRDTPHAAKAASAMGYCFFKRSTARNMDSKKAQEWQDWQDWQDWLNGMKWKLQACKLYKKLRKTNPDDQENIKNYALNADSIGYAYLRKANQSQANLEEAKKYWLKGMQWKEKAYTLFETSSQTDPSIIENCAKTAVKIAKEFAKKGINYKAIEWYEKALEHDPECTHIKKNDQDDYKTLILAEQLEIVQTLGWRTRL